VVERRVSPGSSRNHPPHYAVMLFSPAPEWFRPWTEVTTCWISYFKYPGVLRRMRRGPLADYIDGFADEFARLGYTRATVIRYLSLLATFSRYAGRVGHVRPETIDVALVETLSPADAEVCLDTDGRTLGAGSRGSPAGTTVSRHGDSCVPGDPRRSVARSLRGISSGSPRSSATEL